jgi:hypothetical protein
MEVVSMTYGTKGTLRPTKPAEQYDLDNELEVFGYALVMIVVLAVIVVALAWRMFV